MESASKRKNPLNKRWVRSFLACSVSGIGYVIDVRLISDAISQWRTFMIFIETEIFTEDVKELLDDDEYRIFQVFLAVQPDRGALIPGTGGLRKVRWTAQGKGKRGGGRIIYFHHVGRTEIRLLLIYRKGIKDDLSPHEKTILAL